MFRTFLFATLSLALTTPTNGEDWEQLFNGEDLAGWRANNSPESFSVEDGVLRIQASDDTAAHLFYVGDRQRGFESYRNFELEAVVKAEPNSNSGIFFHTDMSVRNAQKHLAKGYEVQLNSTEKERRKTGSLYAIVDLATSPVDETEWFTIRVVVVDQQISVYIDGELVIDYSEPDNPRRAENRKGRVLSEEGGAIALQAHDRESIWYFQEIRLKRLP